jgi:rhomboid protease GluP
MNKKYIITYSIIIINIIIFILETLAWGSTDTTVAFNFWAHYTPIIAYQPRRLFTAMFLHFGILHLAMNMLALNNLWPVIEQIFWKRKYLLIYIFSGLAGNLTVFTVESITGNYSLSAWASWAIFGILWAYLAITLALSKESKWNFDSKNVISTIIYALAPWFFISWISMSAHLWWLIWWFIISYILIILTKKKLKQNT